MRTHASEPTFNSSPSRGARWGCLRGATSVSSYHDPCRSPERFPCGDTFAKGHLMGWLRDLMAATEPKLKSYGELARRCLEHETWPLDIQPQARSLASLFSKFDRGIEVEWLHDRPEVQVVLAHVLRVSAASLTGEVKKHVASADQYHSRWRLRSAPATRPIDLKEEGVPPVFPDALFRPGLWGQLWWADGMHQGAELFGRWLSARALAEFAMCFEWHEVVS